MSALPFFIEPMRMDDVPEVSRVERRCFTNPWPVSAYRRELRNLEQNHYIVLRGPDAQSMQSRGRFVEEYTENWRGLRALGLLSFTRKNHGPAAPQPIIGFAGMWQLFDEAHVTTIGVDLPYRGRGFGEAMLLKLLDEAVRRGANVMTLEVRVSNASAIKLYEKYGFTMHGTRPHYYSDNGEDAYLMWSPPLRDPEYLESTSVHRQELASRLADVLAVPAEMPIWASRRIDDRHVS